MINDVKSQLIRLINKEPNTADQKPEIPNPEITPDTIISNSAFRTNVKRPKVRIVIGRVKIKRIGLKTAFNMPKLAAAKKAEKKPLT